MENHREISRFKEKLEYMKEDIIDRLQKISDSKTRIDGALDPDTEEQLSIEQNNEVVDKLDELERRELFLINDALERIEDGTYGQCLNCGAQISSKRLIALPFATLCIDCAQ